MSWNITHQCRFQSRTGQQYCVNISKQTDTGQNIKQLTGSEHPFVTSEANGDDIFMPIRQQTGYLRVLDNSGGTLIDELLPENNTQKMVTLVNLTTGKTEWIGFLAAEVFTQPWGNELTELEFPLKSALACLSDVTIQAGQGGNQRLAALVYNAISAIFGNDNVPFTEIVLMDDFSNICDELLIRANFDKFFRDEVIMNSNTEMTIRVGNSFKNALSAMCSVFGLTLRQQGTSLIFGKYDDGTGFPVNVNVLGWDILEMIANKKDAWPYDSLQPQGQIVTRDILPIADFRGSNNKQTFIQGAKAAIVTVDVGTQNLSVLQMPQSDIRSGDVTTIHNVAIELKRGESILSNDFTISESFASPKGISIQRDGRTSVQGYEVFEYYKCATSGTFARRTVVRNHEGWQQSNRDECFDVTVFGGYMGPEISYDLPIMQGLIYYNWDVREVRTGAIPCRWSINGETLKNGLLLVQDVWHWGNPAYYNDNEDTGDSSAWGCYTIYSQTANNLQNCYININFDMELIYSTFLYYDPGYVFVNTLAYCYQWNKAADAEIEFQMPCVLHAYNGSASKYWNGGSWQDSWVTFNIIVKNGDIKSNKTAGMNLDEDSGWFVPSPNIDGATVEFKILNKIFTASGIECKYSDTEKELTPVYPFQKILTELTIGLVYSREITSSNRSSNVYRRTIIDAGFSEDKQTDLTFGTYNNNYPSPSLLRTYGNDGYVETIGYTASDGSVVAERPEMHLLNRMVEYYKTMRRTMEAKIATGIDLFRNRFSYNGRKYMAIDKKHDWEREEQEVKFIEVT